MRRISFHLCGNLLPNPQSQSNHGEKNPKNLKWKDILRNTWLGLLEIVTVMGNKEKLRKCPN